MYNMNRLLFFYLKYFFRLGKLLILNDWSDFLDISGNWMKNIFNNIRLEGLSGY